MFSFCSDVEPDGRIATDNALLIASKFFGLAIPSSGFSLYRLSSNIVHFAGPSRWANDHLLKSLSSPSRSTIVPADNLNLGAVRNFVLGLGEFVDIVNGNAVLKSQHARFQITSVAGGCASPFGKLDATIVHCLAQLAVHVVGENHSL